MRRATRNVARATLLVARVGSRGSRAISRETQKATCLAESGDPRSHFGTTLNPKWLQYRTFEVRSALGPSKDDLWEGGLEKH